MLFFERLNIYSDSGRGDDRNAMCEARKRLKYSLRKCRMDYDNIQTN